MILPGPTDRTAIVGRTGSGKTTFASWMLSHANIDRVPWVIIDYKGERIFRTLQRRDKTSITELNLSATAPRRAGLNILRPVPSLDDEKVDEFLWKIWDRGKTGIYIDEAHLLPSSDALRALLVTGRSRRIPMIVISQRPVWVPREVFSEANQHISFDLVRADDRKLVGAFMSRDGEPIPRLETYHSYWHDVDRNQRWHLLPAPSASESIDRIMERAPRRLRWL